MRDAGAAAAAAAAAPTRAQPSAAKESASLSVGEDARVKSLPYKWDMLQIFLTYKMAGTLHHDVEEHVDNMREAFPDVFSEDRAETMRDLPQTSLRFLGVCDREAVLQPLSVRLSLTQPVGRYEDLGRTHSVGPKQCADRARTSPSRRYTPLAMADSCSTTIRRSWHLRPSSAASITRERCNATSFRVRRGCASPSHSSTGEACSPTPSANARTIRAFACSSALRIRPRSTVARCA